MARQHDDGKAPHSVKRIDFSLQMSNSSTSACPPPWNIAVTDTVQRFSFGSLRLACALGARGLPSRAVWSSPETITSSAVLRLAFTTVRACAGVGPAGLGFGLGFGLGAAAATGAAPASAGAGAVGDGAPGATCAAAPASPARRAAPASPAAREERIVVIRILVGRFGSLVILPARRGQMWAKASAPVGSAGAPRRAPAPGAAVARRRFSRSRLWAEAA